MAVYPVPTPKKRMRSCSECSFFEPNVDSYNGICMHHSFTQSPVVAAAPIMFCVNFLAKPAF